MPASLSGPTSPQYYSHVPTWPGTSLGPDTGPFAHSSTDPLCDRGEPCPSLGLSVWRAPKNSPLVGESSCLRFKAAPSTQWALPLRGYLLKMFPLALLSAEECQNVNCLHTNCHVPLLVCYGGGCFPPQIFAM